jgi:LysR family hydrogen peroxide-inducible transcriptional activator
MELHQLRYFVAVAEEGGFSRAAARLHVAQPSLSQQIRKLERELGQPLLDRLPRGVVLTPAGRHLLTRARRILAETADAARCVRDCGEPVQGRLVIGAIPTIAPGLLPELLGRFARAHPAVEVEVIEEITERLLHRIEEGDLDLALTSTVRVHTALQVERVGEEPLCVLVPDGHPLTHRPAVRWSDLRGLNALVLSELHCLGRQVAELCKAHQVRWRALLQAAHLGTVVEMVAQGLGVALAPHLVDRLARGRGCRLLPLVRPEPRREICLVRHNLRYRTRAALAFAELVRGHWAARAGAPPAAGG